MSRSPFLLRLLLTLVLALAPVGARSADASTPVRPYRRKPIAYPSDG